MKRRRIKCGGDGGFGGEGGIVEDYAEEWIRMKCGGEGGEVGVRGREGLPSNLSRYIK